MHAFKIVSFFVCALAIGMFVNVSLVSLTHSVSVQTVYTDYVYRSSRVPDFEGIAKAFKQSTPNTCGAAATTYLLSFLGDLVMEEQFVRYAGAPPAEGYSLLDMSNFIGSRGFVARSFFGQLTDLPKPGDIPAIAHLERGHYLVIHAVTRSRVVFFDPSYGVVRSESPEMFLADWSGRFLKVSTL